MGNKVLIKRSAVPGKVPQVADLDYGELAINTADGKLFFKKNVGGSPTVLDVSEAIDAAKIKGIENAVADAVQNSSYVKQSLTQALSGSAGTTIATTSNVQTTSLVNAIIFG